MSALARDNVSFFFGGSRIKLDRKPCMGGLKVHLYQDVYDGLIGDLGHKSRAEESGLHVNGVWGGAWIEREEKSACGMGIPPPVSGKR